MNRLTLIISFVLVSFLFFAQNNFTQDKNSKSAQSDDNFPQKAYSGGMMEVQLGKLAQQNASSSKVKQFGERMVTDHSNGNKELKDIADKNNIILPDNMLDENKSTYDELSKYNGSEFDKEYMDTMVKDHKKDISEFEEAAKNDSGNKDIQQWAKKILPTLKEHLKMAEQIQKNLKKNTSNKQTNE
jgi:putative membrane protein